MEQAAKAREIHRDEVAKHRSSKSVWVTYKDGVYDVTEFAAQHPGGAARLMLAAGGAIDPFWAMYVAASDGRSAPAAGAVPHRHAGAVPGSYAWMHFQVHLCLHGQCLCSNGPQRQPLLSCPGGCWGGAAGGE